jgi:uncharacterized protein (TIGR03118 family)
MKIIFNKSSLLCLTAIIFLWGCDKNSPHLKDFKQVNLVGDNDAFNPLHVDANLVNAWGVVFPASGPAWVTSFGTGKSVVYNGDGTTARPPVSIPSRTVSVSGHPTGIVVNTTTDFLLPNGSPARFIFAQADGLISGWNGGNDAAILADGTSSAVFFGIALGSNAGSNFLYVANFSQGRIDVYNRNMEKINMTFRDPYLPQGYTPLNIQNIDGKLFVMYGQPGTGTDVISPRNGFIDIFNTDGTFLRRFISQGHLNAPWGIAKAPAEFFGDQQHAGDVFLVGNFGDGYINAYNANGIFQGQLRAHGNPIKIEKLWGIAFAPVTSTVIDHDKLYFAAGPGGEQHGLFGYIGRDEEQVAQ